MSNKIIQIKDGSDDAFPVNNDSANGHCKMADGTLIEYGQVSITAAVGGRNSTSVYFQQSFIDAPSVSVTVANGTRPDLYFATARNVAADHFTIYYYNGHSADSTMPIDWLAIGRWK